MYCNNSIINPCFSSVLSNGGVCCSTCLLSGVPLYVTCKTQCTIWQCILFDSSFVESQMKKLLTSWHSFTGFALRSSSVDMDMKVVILNMCFCLNGIAKISAAEIGTALRLLCEDVITGIKNVIMSVSESRKKDVLGLGLEFKMELHVSCISRFVLCMFLNQWNCHDFRHCCAGLEFHAFRGYVCDCNNVSGCLD